MGTQAFEDLNSQLPAIYEKEVVFYCSCPDKLSSVRLFDRSVMATSRTGRSGGWIPGLIRAYCVPNFRFTKAHLPHFLRCVTVAIPSISATESLFFRLALRRSGYRG